MTRVPVSGHTRVSCPKITGDAKFWHAWRPLDTEKMNSLASVDTEKLLPWRPG